MKIIKIIIVLLLFICGFSVSAQTLKAGVVKIDNVPNSFYDTRSRVAKIDKQSGNIYFKPVTVDIWNLSRSGDVINLNNPFTGASASVKLDYVEGNIIRFTKTGEYDGNKKLTDTVDLKLDGNTFTGVNYITLTLDRVFDNSLIKKDSAYIFIKRGKDFRNKYYRKMRI